MSKSSNEANTILIVDDEELLAEILKETLEVKGYQVETANNGTQALRRVVDGIKGIRSQIGLVFTDFDMGEMNGMQLIRNIHTVNRHIPVIMHTGRSEAAEKEARDIEMPMPPIFKKPYKIDALLKQIHDIFHPKK